MNTFRTFMCIGRFKNLDSLKFFRFIYLSSRSAFPKHRVPHAVFPSKFLLGYTVGQHLKANDLILVEPDDEQQSLFYSIICVIINILYLNSHLYFLLLMWVL